MSWKSISSLRVLFTYLVLLGLLPVLGLISYNERKQRQIRIERVHSNVTTLASSIGHEENHTIVSAAQLLTLFAESRALDEPASCQREIHRFLQFNKEYAAMGVADLSGDLYCSGGTLPTTTRNLVEGPYFQRVIETGKCSTGGYSLARITHIPSIHVACPVTDGQDKMHAIIVLSIPLDVAYRQAPVFIKDNYANFTMAITGTSGAVLAYRTEAKDWILIPAMPEAKVPAGILRDNAPVTSSAGPGGIPYVYTASRLSSIDGRGRHLVLGIPAATVYGEIDREYRRFLWTALLTALLSLMLVILAAQSYILSPVSALVEAAKRLSQGDFRARTGASYKTAELGRLAQCFDSMAQSLEQREAERLASEAKFRDILEAAPDGMVIVNESGLITLANKQAGEMFKYSREELIGQHVEMLIPNRFRLAHGGHRATYFTQAVPRKMGAGLELQGLRKDGTEFPIDIGLAPVKSEEGSQAIASMRDISEQKRLTSKLQDYASELRKLTAHLQTAREKERNRIAREIHDELGQALSGLKLNLHAATLQVPQSAEDVIDNLRGSLEQIDDIIASVQRICTELRPAALYLGLISAIEWQVEQFESRSGISCDLHFPKTKIVLDDHWNLAIFRIIQEALTNIARHSGANRAAITLKHEDNILYAEVRDNGKGFTETELGANSLGILGMKERALSLGGTITIQGNKGKGAVLQLRIPLSLQ